METKGSGSATTTAVQIAGHLVFLISLEVKYRVLKIQTAHVIFVRLFSY